MTLPGDISPDYLIPITQIAATLMLRGERTPDSAVKLACELLQLTAEELAKRANEAAEQTGRTAPGGMA